MAMVAEEGDVAGPAPALDPFDPVALEARLVEARARRAQALAARTAPSEAVLGPSPLRTALSAWRGTLRQGLVRVSGRMAGVFLTGLAAGLAPVVFMAMSRGDPEPTGAPVTVAAVVPPPPTPMPAAKAPMRVAKAPMPAAKAPMPAAGLLLAEPLGPEPRPAAHSVPRLPAKAVRSARNAPAAPPEVIGRIVREVNAATVGRTAAALGVRERVAVKPLSVAVVLDRRGLRLVQQRGHARGRGHRDR